MLLSMLLTQEKNRLMKNKKTNSVIGKLNRNVSVTISTMLLLNNPWREKLSR